MGLIERLFGRNLSNEKLERCMAAASDPRASPETLQELYRVLLSSRLMAATPKGAATAEASGKARFVGTTGPNGERAMVLFTSDAALRAWDPAGSDALIAPAKDLFGMALRSGLDAVMINPQGPVRGMIDRRALAALAEGRAPPLDEKSPSIVAPEKMVFGPPKKPPRDSLLDAVRSECEKIGEVRAAYLVEVSIERGESHLLLALALSDGAPEEAIVRRMMERLKGVLAAGEYVDVMPMAAAGDQSKRIAAIVPPSFSRVEK